MYNTNKKVARIYNSDHTIRRIINKIDCQVFH